MTLAEAQTMLAACKTAYTAALAGRSVSFQDRAVTRQDLPWLSAELDKWERRVAALQAQATGSPNPGIKVATWS